MTASFANNLPMLMNENLHNKVSYPYSNHPNQNIVRLGKDQTAYLALSTKLNCSMKKSGQLRI